MKYRESTYKQLQWAIEFMDRLPIDNADNALWHCLHQIVWHEGIDRILWISSNQELVKKLAQKSGLLEEDLRNEFLDSIRRFKIRFNQEINQDQNIKIKEIPPPLTGQVPAVYRTKRDKTSKENKQ
jgi:hypothetical protein